MSPIEEVPIGPLDPNRFSEVMSDSAYREFGEAMLRGKDLFAGRRVWNVNSTSRGGGVAEMLASLIAYAQGAEIEARWVVIEGREDFFAVTKRIHNNLHGAEGDGGPLGDDERAIYEDVLAENLSNLEGMIAPTDIVILHDPQTAGLTEALKEKAAAVLWRCHVGLDHPNDVARRAWDFLRPYVEPADRYIFSRRAFAWEKLDDDKLVMIAPSIDAFSPKNQDMSLATVDAIVATAGLLEADIETEPTYVTVEGDEARVERKAEMFGAPAPPATTPLVVQVSRWDSLKDPLGVMEGFAAHVAPHTDAHLMLAGPSVAAVADDPEGAEVLRDAQAAWEQLPGDTKERVHLTALPMDDLQENAAIVNALQRRANVIVQKSIAEGFGLTVAEGMWKARPVVATRIGGIQDQISNGDCGVLIDDPHDLEAFGEAVRSLIDDPERAKEIGRNARERVTEQYLGPRHLMEYLDVVAGLDLER